MERDSAEGQARPPVGVLLRPVATSLPAGFLGLMAASMLIATVELGWIPTTETRTVAAAALALAVPLQLVASVFGYLARDTVACTAMGLLAGTWASVGITTLMVAPGPTSRGQGVLLLVSAAAVLVPGAAGLADKVVPSAVVVLAAVRFVVTGVYQLTGSPGWQIAAGSCGVVVAVLAYYTALAAVFEDTRRQQALPLLRRGRGRVGHRRGTVESMAEVIDEPGVRTQL